MIALDAKTGQPVAGFGKGGIVDLFQELDLDYKGVGYCQSSGTISFKNLRQTIHVWAPEIVRYVCLTPLVFKNSENLFAFANEASSVPCPARKA